MDVGIDVANQRVPTSVMEGLDPFVGICMDIVVILSGVEVDFTDVVEVLVSVIGLDVLFVQQLIIT